MHRLLAFSFLVVAACGAEVEPVASGAPDPNGDGSSTQGPQGSSSSSSSSESAEQSAPSTLVKIRNTSTTTRWIKVDAQSVPFEFQVGAIQLNAYGGAWCGNGTHNDPTSRFVRLDPGGFGDLRWYPMSVTRGDDCWKSEPIPPGDYATQACYYESETTPAKDAKKICDYVTLTIPQGGGETILDL